MFITAAIKCYSNATCAENALIGNEKDSVDECCKTAENGGIEAAYYNDGLGCMICPGMIPYTFLMLNYMCFYGPRVVYSIM